MRKDVLEAIVEDVARGERDPVEMFRGRDWSLSGGTVFARSGKRIPRPREVRVDDVAAAVAKRQYERALAMAGIFSSPPRKSGVGRRAVKGRERGVVRRVSRRLLDAAAVLARYEAAGIAEQFPRVLRRCFPEVTLLSVYRASSAGQ